MKLGDYLFLALSAVFAAILAGVQLLQVYQTRDYLSQQLEAHAQETATAIALAIGNASQPDDATLAETIARPAFDRGQFRRIAVIDAAGHALVDLTLATDTADAPAWFVQLFPIHPPGGEALIAAGWRQLGRVAVEPLPALAYGYLWQIALRSAAWLAALFALSLLLARFLLSFVLSSLGSLEAAARDLGDRRFHLIDSIPRARELRSVVGAFNTLSRKIRDVLDSEATRVQKLQAEAFNDGLTGLYNRRGLLQRLQTLLEPGGAAGGGVFALCVLDGLARFRAMRGFGVSDDLVREAAEIVARALAGRAGAAGYLGEGTFALVWENLPASDSEAVVVEVSRALQAAVERAERHSPLQANAGAVRFEAAGQEPGRLFAAADFALAQARNHGAGGVHVLDARAVEGALPRGAQAWQALIRQALQDGRISLMAQRVLSVPAGALLHREVMACLVEIGGQTMPARDFVPMALRHQLGALLDRTVFDQIMVRLRTGALEGRVAMNVTGQSLDDAEFLEHLRDALSARPDLASRLVFEIAESSLLAQPQAAQAFAALVRPFGCGIAIDNFFVSGESIRQIHALLPAYVKLAQSYNPEGGGDSRFVISSLARITRPLDVALIVLGIEHAETLATLGELGVDGAQGYAVDMPVNC